MKVAFERTLTQGQPGFAGFMEAIGDFVDGCDLPVEVSTRAMIAFDEIVSNVLNHAAAGTAPSVTVRIDPGRGEFVAEVSDDGAAFDPTSLPDPDTSLSVEDRKVGGLGIFLVRQLMDRVDFQREGGCNTIRFAKTYAV